MVLTSVRPKVIWRRSKSSGRVDVVGRSDRATTLELTLLRGGRALARRTIAVPAGAFVAKIKAPRGLVPGRYRVRAREIAAGTIAALPERALSLRLVGPPEGVVAASFASAIKDGPAAAVLDRRRRIFANFHFAALPARRRVITTAWYIGARQIGRPVVRPRKEDVGAYLQTGRGDLPAGDYRCVLRAGRSVVAVASLRLR
jgi:hypothetical protein